MRRSWMTMIATIAAAVSFGSRRPMKSTFRPDFDSDGLQIIWDREFGFLKETLVAPVPRVAIMLGRTFGEATAATLQGCIVLLLALFFVFTRIVAC
jgi:ABC-type multidrug transport system permease subunit